MDQPKSKDPQKELEIAVAELEERVDRLRALYEQYFMGYEKLEPSIQRKDVDRRFTHLRKQQIRNTALRFKFNVITQKFQTYSMYWTRVCRQIEEGTYKRHVIKAARRFGGTETKREHDDAIDVELGDFEEVDMDALLAEIDAETAAHEPSGLTHDTVPPGMLTVPPAVEVRPFQGAKAAPGAWFSIGGARDAIDVDPSIAEDAVTAGRAPRQAALPPGAKPRVVLRRRPEGDLSPPSAPISHGRSGSSPDLRPSTGAGPISAGQPSKIQHPAPVIRTASGGEGHRPPAVVVAPETARRAPGPGAAPPTVSSTPAVSLPPAVSDPPSAGLPAGGVSAPPSAAAAASTPPSAGRMPASTPSWGAGGAGRRIPAIAPAGSSGRTSLPAGAGVRVPTPASPMTPQAAPAPGAPRPSTTTGPTPGPSPTRPTPASPMAAGPAPTPVAPVAGAPAANRPVPPSANRIPLPSATARATPATPMTPVAPPAPAGVKPAGPPAPASPGPKAPDSEQLRLNRRPPLPSQVKKDS